MTKKRNRMLMTGLFTLVYAITTLCMAFPVYVAAIEADDISAFVDFGNEYLDIENPYTVWGEYAGTEAEAAEDEETEGEEDLAQIQVLSAVYDGEGRLIKAKASDKVTLEPGAPFAVQDSIVLDEDEDLTDAVLKVFLWDGTDGMQALGKLYRMNATAFTYTLEEDARTSAGVFDDEGNLIRTLWGGLEEEAGTYTKHWDGRDDDGVLQTDGEYTVTIMENNVEVEPTAFVGNTSDHSNYDYIMSGYANFLSDMMYVDGKMFYIYPYSEGRQAIYYFDVENPDRKAGEFGGVNRCMQRAVTDGKRMYVFNTEPDIGRTFLYAYDLNSKQMYTFEGQGEWISSFWGTRRAYCAVNILDHNAADFQIGGIGVQTDGNWMFAAYTGAGKVYVVDKNNGTLINSQDFNTPRALAYNDNGGLWVGSIQEDGKYAAQRYLLGENGEMTLDESVSLADDFEYLLYLELSPDGKHIVAADGAQNKYKMYSTETGELIWTFGSGESYEEDPAVYEDKLMLDYKADDTDLAFAEFENDDTLWIGDVGNNRAYKMDISGDEPVVIDDIMLQAGSHSMGIDATYPENVYSNAMQYEMDYSETGRDAWRVVKNWKKQVQAYGIDVVTFNQFNNIITLPNGKTYFSAGYDGHQRLFCYEKNYIRDSGILFDDKIMLDDGRVGSILPEGGYAVYRIHEIIGYTDDELNDPIYDNGTVVARLPNDWAEPIHAFGAMKLNMPITENNIMMTLRCVQMPDENTKKTWHVGGVKIGDGVATDWQWKAAPEGSEFYDGNFPSDGTFEAGNNVVNTAQKVVTNGKNVVFQYNGEFYKNSQTNKHYFYRDNGLLVGVFSEAGQQRQTNENRYEFGKEIYPGNAFDIYLIQDEEDSDRAYIMQNSENGYGNFKYDVTGLDTIKEHTTEVTLENTLWDGLTYSYYVGDATDPTNIVSKELRETVAREAYEDEDDFTMIYTGYLTNPNGTGTLKLSVSAKEATKLTIAGKELFNGTGAGNPEIYLEEGKLYPFKLEVKRNDSTTGGRTRISLGYYNTNNRVTTFTKEDFKTEEIPYVSPYILEYDFLEGLPFASEIKSGTYGFTRSTEGNVGGISLNTNSTNPGFDDVRDIRFNANLWPTEGGWWPRFAWFEKNLGEPRKDMWSWELEMDVARVGYINYGALGDPANSVGIHIDVLDVNDKVIARFFWAQGNRAYGNGHMIHEATDIYDNNLSPELYSVPGSYDNQFNTASPLKITGRDGKITFQYYGKEVRTTVLQADADWTKPLKVKVDAFFNYDCTQAREMNMSITKFNYTQNLTGIIEEEPEEVPEETPEGETQEA